MTGFGPFVHDDLPGQVELAVLRELEASRGGAP
jgi:hypothetical protein